MNTSTANPFSIPQGTPAAGRAVLKVLQRLQHGSLTLQLPDGSMQRFGGEALPADYARGGGCGGCCGVRGCVGVDGCSSWFVCAGEGAGGGGSVGGGWRGLFGVGAGGAEVAGAELNCV